MAIVATAAVLLIAVHGIFLHQDTHAKASQSHACTLCEISHFTYTVPDAPVFVAETFSHPPVPVFGDARCFVKPVHRLGLRGPPGNYTL